MLVFKAIPEVAAIIQPSILSRGEKGRNHFNVLLFFSFCSRQMFKVEEHKLGTLALDVIKIHHYWYPV